MRILQTYRFSVGTKIPFDRLPGMIDEFLREQNLRHHSFHYFFKDFDQSRRCLDTLDGTKCATCVSDGNYCDICRKKAENTLRKGTACQRATRENPFLGAIQAEETKYNTLHLLHNFMDESNTAKEAEYYFTRLFDTLSTAEKTVFPAILDCYPATPDWFVPSH